MANVVGLSLFARFIVFRYATMWFASFIKGKLDKIHRYDLYLVTRFLSIFGIIEFYLGFIVWLVNFAGLAKYILETNAGIIDIIIISIGIMPKLLVITAPLACGFAIITLCLSLKTEILIFKSIGMSDVRIASPILVVAFAIMILCYIMHHIVVPRSLEMVIRKEDTIGRSYVYSKISEKKFFTVNNLSIYLNKLNDNSNFDDLIIKYSDVTNKSDNLITASSGSFYLDENIFFIKMKDASLYSIAKTSNGNYDVTSIKFDSLDLSRNIKNETSYIISHTASSTFSTTRLLLNTITEQLSTPSLQVQELLERTTWSIFCVIFPLVFLVVLLKSRFDRGRFANMILVAFTFLSLTLIGFSVPFTFSTVWYSIFIAPILFLCIIAIAFAALYIHNIQSITSKLLNFIANRGSAYVKS